MADESSKMEAPVDIDALEPRSPKNPSVNGRDDIKAIPLEKGFEPDATDVAAATDESVKKIADAAKEEEAKVEKVKEELTKKIVAADAVVAKATVKAKEVIEEVAASGDAAAVADVKDTEVKKLVEVKKAVEKIKEDATKDAKKAIVEAKEVKEVKVAKATEQLAKAVPTPVAPLTKLKEVKKATESKAIKESTVVKEPPARKSIRFKPLVVTEDVRQLCLGEVYTDKSQTDTTVALCPVTFDGKCPTTLNASCTQDREVIAQVLSRTTKITPIG